MIHINPKYIIDDKGNKQAVLLPLEEFNAMIDALEEADDVRLYNQAKKEKLSYIDGDQAFLEIEKSRIKGVQSPNRMKG